MRNDQRDAERANKLRALLSEAHSLRDDLILRGYDVRIGDNLEVINISKQMEVQL